jgi:branched-chain amino acid transport system substrate-binding protein
MPARLLACSLAHAPTPPSLSRRALLGAAATAPLWLAHPARAQDSNPIRLGQTTALTGPLADMGQALQQGALVYFESVNAAGGVEGRKIELLSKDDAYEAKRGAANIEALMADASILALFNCFGTPIVEAALPKLTGSGMPFFAPLSGAQLARPKERNFFNIRASYADEVERLVTHLATIGVKRVGFVWQNNAFGKESFESAKASAARHQFTATADASLESNGTEAEANAAVTKLLASEPEAVIVLLAGKPSTLFVKAARRQRKGLALYAMSVLGAADVLHAMGDDGVGVTISQVVPLPTNVTVGVVRDFQAAWKKGNPTVEPSHLALEGYINARVFVEVLKRAGRNPSRASIVEAMWKLKKFDLGGFEVSAGEPGSNASRFIELTMVARNGRFVR